MSWKIPNSVRKIFDTFPLKVNEPAKLPLDGIQNGSTQIYVYNLENGICTDPHCLEVQSLLKLKGDNDITITAASVHVSPVDSLPFIKSKAQSIDRLQYIRNSSSSSSTSSTSTSSTTTIYSSLIETWLRACWVVTLLDSRNSSIKDSIYILEKDRKELPSQILAVLSNQVNHQLIEQLQPQYLQLSSEVNSYRARIVGYSLDPTIIADVFDRAEECLETFNYLLQSNKQSFLGNLVDNFEISRLDILLFSYTHLILTLLPNSQLAKLIPPSVQSHSKLVYNHLFS